MTIEKCASRISRRTGKSVGSRKSSKIRSLSSIDAEKPRKSVSSDQYKCQSKVIKSNMGIEDHKRTIAAEAKNLS